MKNRITLCVYLVIRCTVPQRFFGCGTQRYNGIPISVLLFSVRQFLHIRRRRMYAIRPVFIRSCRVRTGRQRIFDTLTISITL
ncbi:MAG: hypothetical protein JNL32_05255 [Candidatus Kapabacteria bacterium]|nr:hypothetical protein [Candidatus Kapabacteria bacterium]